MSEDGRGVCKDGVYKVFVGHASAWGCPSDKGAKVRAGICLIVCMCVYWLCVILYIHVHTRGARDHVCRYVCTLGSRAMAGLMTCALELQDQLFLDCLFVPVRGQ